MLCGVINMEWIKELPKESGVYWMKHEDEDNKFAEPVRIDCSIKYVYMLGWDVPLGLYDDDFEGLVFSKEKLICNAPCMSSSRS